MSFHQFQERGQVARPGVGVEEGGFEPAAAVEGGAAEDGAALVEEGAAYGGDGVVGGASGPEEDGADDGVVVELEAGVCGGEVGEFVGVGADLVDEVADAVAPEGLEGDGDLEDVGATGGAQGAAEEVGVACFGVVVGVEVVGPVGEGVRSVGSRTARSPAATGCQPSLCRSRVTVSAWASPSSLVRCRSLKRRPPP